MIVTTPVQTVKLPITTSTRLPFPFDKNGLELWLKTNFQKNQKKSLKNLPWKLFSLFKLAHWSRTKKRKRKRNLIVEEKEHSFIPTSLQLQHWKSKDNEFLCQLCFLSLYLFWLTPCSFDFFYLLIHVPIMNW